MKKIKLFSTLALTLFMASCDDFELPNPPGQTNTDPEAYFADGDLALAPVSEAISLTAANNANQYVTVANITTLNNFPEGYELVVDMEVGSNDQFSETTTVETVIDGNAVTVNPDILNGAIQAVCTKKPGTYDVNVRFPAYAVKDNTRIRLGGVNNYYLTEDINVTTYDPVKVIEDNYYVVLADATGNPDWGSATKMNNTHGEGLVGYDYPEFALKLESPDPNGLYVYIAPASVVESKVRSNLFGVIVGQDGLTGKLVAGANAGHVSITGDVLITVNVDEESYNVNYAFEVLYPFTGSTKPADLMLLYTDNYINYSGVCELGATWYIGSSSDKNQAPIFRLDEEQPSERSEDGLTLTGYMSTSSQTPFQSPITKKNLCWVDANLVLLTYSVTTIETLSVIGSANDWSNDADKVVDLTPSKDHKIWTGENIHIGPEFKLNANHAWVVDFGGVKLADTEGELVYNVTMKGANLECPEGNYDVEVNFTTTPYVVTLKKK